MRIILIGSTGQLGFYLKKELSKYEVLCPKIDITDKEETYSYIVSSFPDIVINTASFIDTTLAEKEPEKVLEINSLAVLNIANACKDVGASLVQLSTDNVFGEYGLAPFTEEDKPDPQNIYGQSKYLAELFIKNNLKNYWIVRTSVIFSKRGSIGKNKTNFLTNIIKESKKKGFLKVKNDEYTSVAYAKDLAKAIHEMIFLGKYGTYHLVNEGRISFYNLAKEILKLIKSDKQILPVERNAIGGIKKPSDTSLQTIKEIKMPNIKDALARCIYGEFSRKIWERNGRTRKRLGERKD